MKASELMIGDYVNYRGQIIKITSLYDKGSSNEVGWSDKESVWVNADNVEPIPITTEILEKNGFKFDGSGQCSMMFLSEPRYSEGQRFNIYVGFKHKTIEVFVAHPIEKSPNWRKINKAYLEVCGPYVHELKHAIRLCKIEKEIEL
jgi:hypothetical protein